MSPTLKPFPGPDESFPQKANDPLVEAITREVESFELLRARVVVHLDGRDKTILVDRDDIGPGKTDLTWDANSALQVRGKCVGRIEMVGQRDDLPLPGTFQALARLVGQVEKLLADRAHELRRAA